MPSHIPTPHHKCSGKGEKLAAIHPGLWLARNERMSAAATVFMNKSSIRNQYIETISKWAATIIAVTVKNPLKPTVLKGTLDFHLYVITTFLVLVNYRWFKVKVKEKNMDFLITIPKQLSVDKYSIESGML